MVRGEVRREGLTCSLEDLFNAQLLRHHRRLVRPRQATTGTLVQRHGGHVLAFEEHAALGGFCTPRQNLQQRGFASAIGANNPQHLTRLDTQRNALQDRACTKVHVDVVTRKKHGQSQPGVVNESNQNHKPRQSDGLWAHGLAVYLAIQGAGLNVASFKTLGEMIWCWPFCTCIKRWAMPCSRSLTSMG